jgi:ADP-heptose:LPS heptosyltransferase/2-polyprenyl-3-methyl-5-hydroxy-6-metoxy-1,4-benzoquinol methylase
MMLILNINKILKLLIVVFSNFEKFFLVRFCPSYYFSLNFYLREENECEYSKFEGAPEKFHLAMLLSQNKIGRTLDFGCGRGEFVQYLNSTGFNAFGVDISKIAIEFAKKKYSKTKFKCISNEEIPKGPFSNIFLLNVIEYLKKRDIQRILSDLALELSRSGKLLICTKQVERSKLTKIIRTNPDCVTLLSARGLASIVTDHGLEVTALLQRSNLEEGYSGGLWCVGEKNEKQSRTGRKVLIEYFATLGDQICLTAVVSKYRKLHPDNNISVHVEYPEIYINNPNVDSIIWNKKVSYAKFDEVYRIKLPILLSQRRMTLQDASAEQIGITLSKNEKIPQIYLSPIERIVWENRFKRPKGFVVGFSPYTRWPSKEWPISRWREVIEWIEDNYKVTILYLGNSARPYPWIGNNLGGLTDIRELALALEQCDLLLSVDNGTTHMAAAVGTPTIALFGPVMAESLMVAPFIFPIQSDGCVGCWTLGASSVPPRLCPKKHNKCMLDITPTDVKGVFENVVKEIVSGNDYNCNLKK